MHDSMGNEARIKYSLSHFWEILLCISLRIHGDTSALSPFCMKMLPFYAQQAAPDVKVKNLRLKKGAAL